MQTRGPDEPPSIESGGFLIFRLRGTVLADIWWQVFLVIIYTVGIVLIEDYIPYLYMNFPDTLVDVLGVVTGLLLCFRTDSAFDRYSEGRQLWSTMTNCVRAMTQGIWLGIKENVPDDLIAKKSALNLLVAFVNATKHYLREEYDYDYEDVQELISHLPRLSTPSSIRPVQSLEKPVVKKNVSSARRYLAFDTIVPTNIPIEITFYISDYLRYVRGRGLVDEETLGALEESLTSLVECLSSFERIQRTPIPLAYSVHLHHSVWIYILALPFQMVAQLDWWTVPSVGLAAFSLLGILSIGWEIENPFGYDTNDLPLDDFCEVIRKEIDTVISSRIAPPEEWIYSEKNYPLSPKSLSSSMELCVKSRAELYRILNRRDSVEFEEPICRRGRGFSIFRSRSRQEDEALLRLVRKDHRV